MGEDLRKDECNADKLKGKIWHNKHDFSGKNLGNYRFSHYTTVDSADKILSSGELWCSKLTDTNDKDEIKLHQANGNEAFVLSLCNSNNEKIPMWYLYSGICGNGVSIAFTPTKMAMLLNDIKSVDLLTWKKDSSFGDPPLERKTLEENQFDIQCGWVFYRKKDAKEVFYRKKWYSLSSGTNTLDMKAFESNNFFVKDYPWEYEKEFRVIIKVKGEGKEIIDKIGESKAKIAIKIPDKIYRDIKIRTAPEFGNVSDPLELQGFKKWAKKKLEISSLGISMDLIGRNKKDINNTLIDKFDELVGEKNYGEICKKISEKQKCRNNEQEQK